MKYNTSNLGTGFLYFYIHFVTELICFFVLGRYIESTPVMWIIFFTYDMLAFVPQAVIGYVSDKFPKICFALIGLGLLAVALLLQNCVPYPFLSLILLCIGNACIHVNGAEVTIRSSNGMLSPSSIFVAGGSFGVLSGKLLSGTNLPYWLLFLLIASAIPFILLAQTHLNDKGDHGINSCKAFKYNNKNVKKQLIIILSVIVVSVRGYMAYGIPTSWNKTTFQTVLLFVFMGIGKALGGILADLFGIRKVAIMSVIFALPLLMFGDNNMVVSLIGVMFFSMTMSVTLAILVSVLPDTPGLAFGLTTIGLFLGSVPVFFFKIKDITLNCIMLSIMTVICIACLTISLGRDVTNERSD